jgi:hypothetical protein
MEDARQGRVCGTRAWLSSSLPLQGVMGVSLLSKLYCHRYRLRHSTFETKLERRHTSHGYRSVYHDQSAGNDTGTTFPRFPDGPSMKNQLSAAGSC